jgi:hypothetical protein
VHRIVHLLQQYVSRRVECNKSFHPDLLVWPDVAALQVKAVLPSFKSEQGYHDLNCETRRPVAAIEGMMPPLFMADEAVRRSMQVRGSFENAGIPGSGRHGLEIQRLEWHWFEEEELGRHEFADHDHELLVASIIIGRSEGDLEDPSASLDHDLEIAALLFGKKGQVRRHAVNF